MVLYPTNHRFMPRMWNVHFICAMWFILRARAMGTSNSHRPRPRHHHVNILHFYSVGCISVLHTVCACFMNHYFILNFFLNKSPAQFDFRLLHISYLHTRKYNMAPYQSSQQQISSYSQPITIALRNNLTVFLSWCYFKVYASNSWK